MTNLVREIDSVGDGVDESVSNGVDVGAKVAGAAVGGAKVGGAKVGGAGVGSTNVAVGGRSVGKGDGDGWVAAGVSVAMGASATAGAQAHSAAHRSSGNACLAVLIGSAHSASAALPANEDPSRPGSNENQNCPRPADQSWAGRAWPRGSQSRAIALLPRRAESRH